MFYPSVTCLPITLYAKCPLEKQEYNTDREGAVHFLTYAISLENKKQIYLLKPLALIPCARSCPRSKSQWYCRSRDFWKERMREVGWWGLHEASNTGTRWREFRARVSFCPECWVEKKKKKKFKALLWNPAYAFSLLSELWIFGYITIFNH